MIVHKGRLTTALKTVLTELDDSGRSLPPPKLAELVIAAYEILESEDGLNLLEQSLEQAEKLMTAAQKKYSASQKAKIISLVYQMLSEEQTNPQQTCFSVQGNVGSQIIINGDLIQHGFTFFAGNGNFNQASGVVGNGDTQVEARQLNNFESLVVDGPINVRWSSSSTQEVSVEGDSNILPLIATEVRGSTLHISCNGGFSTVNRITVLCSAKVLHSVVLNGSGEVDIKDIQQQKLELLLKGSGDIHAAGITSGVKATVQGSGNIDCSSLVAHSAEALLKGSGDIKIHSSENVTAILKGSGDIKIYGNPTVRDLKEQGSGRIKFK